MCSGVTIYIPSFIKIGSDIQKLLRGIHTHGQQGDLISLVLCLQNKESRLKWLTKSQWQYLSMLVLREFNIHTRTPQSMFVYIRNSSMELMNWMFYKLLKYTISSRKNRLLSLIRHGPHWKRRVQQSFYCCVRIRYRGEVSTEPLPSNDWGIHIQTQTDERDFLN
jgi:hypothetical protein